MLKGKKNEQLIETVIGKDTVVEGKIKLSTSLRVDGKILGEVDCKGDVFVGKEGYIEPTLKAKNLIIAGEVKGDVFTSEKVHVQPSGALTGSTTTAGMIIEDGGIFNGNSTIESYDEKAKLKVHEDVSAG